MFAIVISFKYIRKKKLSKNEKNYTHLEKIFFHHCSKI